MNTSIYNTVNIYKITLHKCVNTEVVVDHSEFFTLTI